MPPPETLWPLLNQAGIYADLNGVIDMHCHPNPDFCRRLLDDDVLVAMAKLTGMRAVLIKSHFSATHERAYLAEKAVGGGIRVFGLICLNPSVGGFNPDAVSIALSQGARAVWMPSMWTEHHAAYARATGVGPGYASIGMQFPAEGEGLTILDGNGQVIDSVKQIVDLVAASDVMLATGHLSCQECHKLLAEAKARGVTRTVVHTANYHVMRFADDDLLHMVDAYGAALEFGFSSLPNGMWDPADPTRAMTVEDVSRLIQRVGPENVVLTSDTGQFTTAIPIEAMRLWIAHLRTFGFADHEIDQMTKHVPARLLGLDTEQDPQGDET